MASQAAPGELELVRAFVNTWDEEHQAERFETPDALSGWLAEAGLLDAGAKATPADLDRAKELREAVRALLRHNHGEELDPGAPPALEAAARRAELGVRFDGEPVDARLAPLASGVDGALGFILARMADAMREGSWPRLKVCSAEDCQWAFYDTSRNRSAVWCDMRVCGNRNKVRQYRRRHTVVTPPDPPATPDPPSPPARRGNQPAS
jgi:predicted RNA-binding Zn ribbon-like protein